MNLHDKVGLVLLVGSVIVIILITLIIRETTKKI